MPEVRCAAQYIRMSTDRQDLSPTTQKEAIAAFAVANGIQVIRTYEDQGKSGLTLSNRPSLRRLLRDVADGSPFTEILVYDVSRWGRFQDVDAAAYYEYHCRLHGVQVTYVGEAFANTLTPANLLMKNMKRVMAAEYSRELAAKSRAGQERVIAMGFHMGALPPLGYRRCSVSADGHRRKLLEHGERKLALSDRIEWVLAADAEVALVRRICGAYVSGLDLEEVAALTRGEGWKTEKGRSVSTRTIRTLLRHEALIGNFVWGDKGARPKVLETSPTRRNGSVPRIVDDETWRAIQVRMKSARDGGEATRSQCNSDSRRRPHQLRLELNRPVPCDSYRRILGSPEQLRNQTREFGRALRTVLLASGLTVGFDTRTNILTFWGARVRLRLMWPCDDSTWALSRSRANSQVGSVLITRMAALYRPLDFFLLPSEFARSKFPVSLGRIVDAPLRPYWCRSSEELTRKLVRIAALPQQPASGTR